MRGRTTDASVGPTQHTLTATVSYDSEGGRVGETDSTHVTVTRGVTFIGRPSAGLWTSATITGWTTHRLHRRGRKAGGLRLQHVLRYRRVMLASERQPVVLVERRLIVRLPSVLVSRGPSSEKSLP